MGEARAKWITKKALEVPCSNCGAKVGEACRGDGGALHRARIEDAHPGPVPKRDRVYRKRA